jgi:putative transposase
MSERRFRRTPGGVSSVGVRVVWCPKYRRWILGGRVARRLSGLLERIADERGWQMVAREVMLGQARLLVRVGPIEAPAPVVRAFRGGTPRVLRQEFAHLRSPARCGCRGISPPRSGLCRSQRCAGASSIGGSR